MKKSTKIIFLVVAIVMVLAASVALMAGCQKNKVIMIWGPGNHETVYLDAINQFREENPDMFKGYDFAYGGSGDSGAYSAMVTSVENGAAIYTFANDQTANLANLKALAEITDENLEWSKANNDAAAVESTKLGNAYVAYPLQPDNGYFMYINADAFDDDPDIWDANIENADGTKGNLKAGYTFRDLYAALDKNTSPSLGKDDKGNDITWKERGKVMWPMGDSWYFSGVFFSVGGDYEVTYDEDGKQTNARCWFSCEENASDWRKADFTVGDDAFQCAKNTFTNPDGSVNKHFFFPSDYNQDIENHIDVNQTAWKEAPFAAAMCGTWEAAAIKEAWGDNYRVTVLPTLESDDGERFQMKNFRGYKNLGINPQCNYIMDAPVEERLGRLNDLHMLAQYLCSKSVSLARHESTGAGPANLLALNDESVLTDAAFQALLDQYELKCNYPSNYADKSKANTPIGNGLGYRVQDSVPANYWTPIETFGKLIWAEYSENKLVKLASTALIHQQLFNLQTEIQKTRQ